MAINDAPDFLARFGRSFSHEVVRAWAWGGDDADFGKTHNWIVRHAAPGEGLVEVSASVELQLDQVQLVVAERHPGADTQLILNALVRFDPPAILLDGEEKEFSESAVERLIAEFNEKAAI